MAAPCGLKGGHIQCSRSGQGQLAPRVPAGRRLATPAAIASGMLGDEWEGELDASATSTTAEAAGHLQGIASEVTHASRSWCRPRYVGWRCQRHHTCRRILTPWHTCPLTCCLAQIQAHAFIVAQQPGAALGVWDATGPAGAAGGPLPPAPLGPHSGWVVAAAVLLASRMGRLTAQEARMDVRKLQVRAVRERERWWQWRVPCAWACRWPHALRHSAGRSPRWLVP
jgi:hypothetical protein